MNPFNKLEDSVIDAIVKELNPTQENTMKESDWVVYAKEHGMSFCGDPNGKLNPANIDLLDIIDVEYTVVSSNEKSISSPAFKTAKYNQDDVEVETGLLVDIKV